MAAIDLLADEFNADLDRIKREKDLPAVKRFSERAEALIYGRPQE